MKLKQAICLYNDFSETRHNIQSLTIDEVLQTLGKRFDNGLICIAITIIIL